MSNNSARRLIHIISSNSWGGREQYALDLCRSLLQRKWSISVYTRNALAVDQHFISNAIDLRHIPLGGFFDLISIWSLSRDFLKEQKSTIVHVHNYKDALIAILARKLCRRTSDIRIVMTRHKATAGIDSWLFNKIYRNLDAHIFVSKLAKHQFLTTWQNKQLPFSEEKLFMLHNSILSAPTAPDSEPVGGPKIAMFHGRLSPEKGVETIIEALPKLRDKKIRLWIIGSGDPDYVDSLKHKALALDVMDMIDWKGYVEDVHSFISLCHYGILPSIWQEPFGLSNIEYMSHGKPQICTNNGAQSEYLTEDKEAIFVSPGDSDAMADAMILLTENTDLRKEIGNAAFQKFQSELSWDKFCNKIEHIYSSLLD